MRRVYQELVRLGMLPPCDVTGPEARHQSLLALDAELRDQYPASDQVAEHLLPYRLRAIGLDSPLSPHALGRAIYSLAQRRGFLSNRKALSDDDSDQGVVKRGISELDAAIKEAGARTLGEYFASIDPEEVKIRRRWTARRMYLEEFDAIWNEQSKHHVVLTEESYRLLKRLLFRQRPLKSQRGLVGRCELEKHPVTLKDGTKRHIGRRRCLKACLPYQEFRLLQKVNDLVILHPDGTQQAMTDPQNAELRQTLLDALSDQGEISFGAMRKLFGFKKSKEFDRNYRFNFETDGDAKFTGNRTSAKMSKLLGARWHEMTEQRKTELVDEILQFESSESLRNRLIAAYGFDDSIAEKLSRVVLEDGFGSLSRRAVRKLIPFMRSGQNFHDAKISAGYNEHQVNIQLFELLPPLLKELPEISNPAVIRVLTEMRKVVNAIIRKMGDKPRWIRVELARDLKHGRKHRQKIVQKNRKNEKTRDAAKKRILESELGEEFATEENILKIRLADECGWVCPYSGENIGFLALVGREPQFEIEHIVPLSRSLDNSFLNKTLCKSSINRDKGNKTPWEAFGNTAEYENMLARVRRFSGDGRDAKLRRFMMQDISEGDEFANRQLNETRYAARLATRYLALLFGGLNKEGEHQRVFPTSGRITSYLRQRWNLNSIIGHADKKNRADHRHHAIDALVTALSTPSAVHDLARAAERAEQTGAKLFAAIDPPFKDLIDQTRKCVDQINISSRVNRKISGALHEETILSHPIEMPNNKGDSSESRYHVRKSLDALSTSEIDRIVDPHIKRLVKQKLDAVGKPPQDVFKDSSNLPVLYGKNNRATLIKKVRIEKSAKPIAVGSGIGRRYVNPGANHHMLVVAVLDKEGNQTKWTGEIVTRFEAAQRNRNKENVIQQPSSEHQVLIFTVQPGDHFLLTTSDEEQLYRVLSISKSEIEFVPHTNANPKNVRRKQKETLRKSANSLRDLSPKKVDVDPCGTIMKISTEPHKPQ